MIPDAEIAAARAALPSVLPTTLKRAGNLYVGLCPVHQEKTPSFYVYPDDWHFHCFSCGAHGDAISWVRRTKGLAFRDAVRQLVGGVQVQSLPSPATKKAPQATEVPSLVLDLWRTATAPRLASMYLETRGIPQKTLPAALRGHERVLWCEEKPAVEPPWRTWWSRKTKSWWCGIEKPAMIAAVTDSIGRITAIQQTWIETCLVYDGHTNFEKGARCPDLSVGKKSRGPLGSGAVRLAAAEEVLGLAEGVESALAAAKLFRLPVWAVCGNQRLGNVELPECVKHVVIFGDNDPNGVGQAAAAKAEALYRRRGYSVQSEFPETDWCEAVK